MKTTQFFDATKLEVGDMVLSDDFYGFVIARGEISYCVEWEHNPEYRDVYLFKRVTQLTCDRVIQDKKHQLAFLLKYKDQSVYK